MERQHIDYLTEELIKSDEMIWINPVGGLGDVIMLSTVIKMAYDKYGKQFNMARRTKHSEFFKYHPGIKEIGHPTKEDWLVCNDYWMREEFADVNCKALSIMKKIFAVEDNLSEDLYVAYPPEDESTRLLLEQIPWQQRNVVIAPSSDSPRKMMHPIKWHNIVNELISQRCFVVQVGNYGDIPIQGAYCLLGVTTPMQIFSVLNKANLVITCDSLIMHAARAKKIPTITLFGPTEASRYGYTGHFCLQANTQKCPMANQCLGPDFSENYSKMCPMNENHCMNQHEETKILDIAINILNQEL